MITPKGRVLFETISKMGLEVISSGHSTYWPTDRQKIPDVIDFGVVKGFPVEWMQAEPSFDLSSDHSPTIISVRFPQETGSSISNLPLTVNRVRWLKYRKFLSTHCTENIVLRTPEDIGASISSFSETLKQAAELAT